MEVNNSTQDVKPDQLNQPPYEEQPVKQRGYFLPIMITLIVIALVGTGGYLLYQKQTKQPSNLAPSIESSSPSALNKTTVQTPSQSSPSTPIASCSEITSGGNYSLSQDIATPSNRCLDIHDVSNVNLDCQKHSITAGQAENIRVAKVQNFSIRNCNLVINLSESNPSGGDAIVMDDSASGIVENNITSEGGVRSRRSNHIQVLNNTVKSRSPFAQHKSSFNQIRDNKFTADPIVADPQIALPAGFIGSGGADGVVVSDSGSNNTIENNIIDGSSDGIFRQQGNVGADDGILLAGGEKDVNIIGNTIKNIWDCGIENIGPIEGAQINKNKINNAGVCGIGGWYWNSWLKSTIDSNIIEDTPTMFYFYRANSLLDEQNGLSEQNVFFKDNTFSNNIFLRPRISPGKSLTSASIDFNNMPVEIPSSAVKLGNNIFKNNDFGQTIVSPMIIPSSIVVDQGGNKCLKVNDDSHPLECK